MPAMSDDGPTVSIVLHECRFARFRFEVVRGPDRGRSAISDGPEFSIGSAPDNQLVLTDPTVSRRHCLVRVTPEGFLLRDLGSTNGTRLAGFRVTAAYLKPGAAVTVG